MAIPSDPYHSTDPTDPRVHHVFSDCPDGEQIDPKNWHLVRVGCRSAARVRTWVGDPNHLFGQMIGTQSPEGWAAIAAGVTAGLIAVGLIFAWRQVGEARRLREARVRPYVVLDFESESTFIHLTIENVGLLPARDVTLEFDPPMRSTYEDPWPPERSTMMTRGIPTLPPGKKHRFFFDSFPARVEANLPLTYEARVQYRAWGRKDSFDEPYTLDLSFLKGLGEARRKTIHDLTEAVEQLSKKLSG